MDQRVRKLWVDALRSGEYKQARERLRTPKGFCCLGVLCDLHMKETKEGIWAPVLVEDGVQAYHPESGIADFEMLPLAVAQWAALESRSPLVGEDELTELNDGGSSFEQIATLIEESL